MQTLPIIDVRQMSIKKSDMQTVAAELDTAFCEVGFCYIANTGIDPDLVNSVFAESQRFHALPDSEKQAISINKFHRGYIAPQSSTIRGSTIETATKPNLSESFMVMHEVDEHDSEYGKPLQGPNQWPENLPGFREIVGEYQYAMTEMARKFNRLLAMALSLPMDYFDPFFIRPTSWLRLLHYPPQPAKLSKSHYGSAPHTDHGFITLLAQDHIGGLEVGTKDNHWIAAPPIQDTFVVNVADMLSRWTNGRWVSTPHRVKNINPVDRYSIPFFWDMDMNTEISCLETCCDKNNPPRFPSVRFGEYVIDKLNLNYHYRQTKQTI